MKVDRCQRLKDLYAADERVRFLADALHRTNGLTNPACLTCIEIAEKQVIKEQAHPCGCDGGHPGPPGVPQNLCPT